MGTNSFMTLKNALAGCISPARGNLSDPDWLYDRNYAVIDLERRPQALQHYRRGPAWLTANQAVMDMLKSRVAPQANWNRRRCW